MLRGDSVICGTSTTGTGTLTLAATPTPPGGVDFDVFARATGIGMGNSAAVFVSYTIIEYTSSAFTTAKQTEKGIGTLTLGGSSGIANATLARTTPQTSATSLNSQPATQNIAPGTGISIGTAANTLVFIGASALEIVAHPPYLESSGGPGGTVSAMPVGSFVNTTTGTSLVSGTDCYVPFVWASPMLAKRVLVSVALAYSGGVPVSNGYGRLYQINSSGRPGKLLYDFGLIGASNSSLNTAQVISSGAAGNGFLLSAGEYFFDFLPIFSGGVTAPKMTVPSAGSYLNTGKWGFNFGLLPCDLGTSTGGNSTAPDPANVSAYATATGSSFNLVFGFATS